MSINRVLSVYDPAKLIHQIAGLALIIENQSFAIRLEFLMQQLVAREPDPSKPPASKGAIRNLLAELENAHWRVCAHEDPVIGYYVSEYYFGERLYRYFRGNVESPHYQFDSFADSTKRLDDHVRQVLGFTPHAALHVVLAINTLIAQRINAPLYTPIPPKATRPQIPQSSKWSNYMDALVITADEVALQTPGIDVETVRLVIEQIAGKQGDGCYDEVAFNPDNHPIVRRPCLDIGDSKYLATSPSLLFAAVRKAIYDAIGESEDATKILDHDFREAVVIDVAFNMRKVHRAYDPVYVCVKPTLNNQQIADVAVFLDRDKVMLISVAAASLADCSDDVWAYADLGSQVENTYKELLHNQDVIGPRAEIACMMLRETPQPVLVRVPEPVRFLKLIVATSPYCSTLAGFNPSDDESWLALPSDIDLICSGVECAQDLIRFLRGVSDLPNRYGEVHAFLLSDLYGMYVDTGRTFYQNVGAITGTSIDPSWGAETAFEQEKKTRWFRLSEHGIPMRGERVNDNRYGIAAEDRSWGAYAIDIDDLHALFFFEPPAKRQDFPGVSVYTADLLSYYFPAIMQALPKSVDLSRLPGYALVCRVVSSPVEGNEDIAGASSPNDESDALITFRSGRTQPHGNYTIEMRVSPALYSLFGRGSNQGERQVVRTLLHGLSRGVSSYLGSELDIDSLLDVVVPESSVRKFTVSAIEQNVETTDLGYHDGLSIHPYDESRLLDEVAELVKKEGLTEQYPALPAVETLLRHAVAQLFAKLEAGVKEVAGPDFARFVYDQLESTLFERVHQTWEVAAVESTFDGYDPAAKMEEHMRNVGKKLSAQRFLLEMVACYQSESNPAFSIERYLEILALCHVITELGSIADDIRFGLSIARVELMPSKRFEFHRKDGGRSFDLLSQVNAAQSLDVARRIFTRLSHADNDSVGRPDEEVVLRKIDGAFLAEYGYSVHQLIDVFIELSKYSAEQSELSTIITLDQAVSLAEQRTDLPGEVCKSVIEHRCLHKRESLKSAGVQWSDVVPWRSYRQLSLTSKPILRLCVDGTDSVLFGPKILVRALRQVLDRAASGLLTGSTPTFRKTMSQLANSAGRKLEDETAARITDLDWETRPRIKRKVKGTDGKPFWGEVDVLAWHECKKILIVIECKDLQRSLNPYAFAEELRKFYEEGSEESFVPRLRRKVSWFKDNLEVVLPQLGVQATKIGKWRVKGMIITDDAHLSAYIGKPEYQIVPLNQLTNQDMLL